MTFWRVVCLVGGLEIAALAYWHPGLPEKLPRIMPRTEPVIVHQPPTPPRMATEQTCKSWGYPDGQNPIETVRVCVDRPIPSPF